MEYLIPESNMPKLKEKLAKIERKCKKYGCEFSFTEKSVEYENVTDKETGMKKTLCFVTVDVSGKSVINGWQFVAEVDHTEKGNIIQGFSNVEIPERYYNSDCYCEHCKTIRRRNNTYIVRKVGTDEFKQVGKTCLLDYTHGLSAESVANYMSYFSAVEDAQCFSSEEFARFTNYISRDEFLKYVAETVRCFGYEKGKTGYRAEEIYEFKNGKLSCVNYKYKRQLENELEKVGFNANREENKKMISDALAWVEKQDESNNYMHNLRTACALDYVKSVHYNLLASLFPAYNRDLEYKAKIEREKEAEKSSEYVGKIKDRITVDVVDCKVVTSYYTEFGITKIYKMCDASGNVYVWKTTNEIEREKFTITGTVKDHKEFRGVKQTELTRCRVA